MRASRVIHAVGAHAAGVPAGGKTGIVRALDWAAGTMVIDVLWQPQATRYRLQSAGVTRQDAQEGTIIL